VPLALVASWLSEAWAQGTRSPDGEASQTLDQVIVTATKRNEMAADVPISVTAYDQEVLERLDARDFTDVALLTPGVSYRPAFQDTSTLAIRGIYSTLGAATTGTYIDDTPIQVRALGAGNASTNFYPVMFDLQRVEVLRGPQGTLFGAGAEGGVIRFITNPPNLVQPSLDTRASVGFTKGGAPSSELGAVANAPLSPGLIGLRVSVYGREDGGWIDRVSFPSATVTSRDINSTDTLAANATMTIAPADDLSITPGIYYQRMHANDLSVYWRNLSEPAAGAFRTGYLFPQPIRDEFALPSLKIEWHLAGVTLVSNTSYLNRTRRTIGDYTFFLNEILSGNYVTPNNIIAPSTALFSNPQTAFTHETRLQSLDTGGPISWTLGVFYEAERQGASEYVYTPGVDNVTRALFGSTLQQLFGLGLGAQGLAYSGIDTSHDDQTALFGEAKINITHRLAATLGARVAWTRFRFTNSQNGPFNGGPTGASGSESEVPVTPKASLSYTSPGNWMLYASAAKGFRAGGANAPVPAATCAPDLSVLGLAAVPASYRSDGVWSYELGAKGRWLGGSLAADASAFYIRWQGIQHAVTLSRCGFEFVANLGSAASKGFDLQTSVRPLKHLDMQLGVSLGYTQALYTQTVPGAASATGANSVIVSDGDRLATPPWQIALTADYSVALARYRGYVHADYEYSSGYDDGDPEAAGYDAANHVVEAVRIASLRVGVVHRDWDLSMFARNLFNSHDVVYVGHQVATSQLFRDEALRPRTVGIAVTFRR